MFLIPLTALLSLLVGPVHAGAPGPSAFRLEPSAADLDLVLPELEPEVEDTAAPMPSCPVGRLERPVALPYQPDLYRVFQPSTAFGTSLMAETLVYAAQEMRFRFPGSDPLVIGDISRRSGGPLSGHRSHREGRDADVGLYMTGARQPLGGFVEPGPGELDLEANLVFIRTLIDTGDVERILLDNQHIRALRRYAIESGAMDEAAARELFLLPEDGLGGSLFRRTGVVHHVPGHTDHFHIQVRCGD